MKFLKLSLLSILLIPAMALAHGPTPLKFDIQTEVSASPDEVWAAVNNLCAIKDWNESITECKASGEGLGANVAAPGFIRVFTLDNGEELKEEVAKVQPDRKKILMTLKVEKGRVIKDIPIMSMGSFISVADNGSGGSTVQIRGTAYSSYEGKSAPPDRSDSFCKAAVEALHTKTLNGLKAAFE
jgi:polyketide cyclase/dehydrase/lipid transport protein